MKVAIGGDRLGSGNKENVSLRNYERSSHDLGYIWRSTMASGTLVPFMSEVGLPGDSFDIDIDCDVKTLPTTGPLYGSYKVQLDVFECPIRLYQGKLHMNMLNIGMDMQNIKLPQLEMKAEYVQGDGDNQQINPSSIYSYLNMRGLGRPSSSEETQVLREFNAVPYLGYWDIYKNYYANKQEERGMVIHGLGEENGFTVTSAILETEVITGGGDAYQLIGSSASATTSPLSTLVGLTCQIEFAGTGDAYGQPDISTFMVNVGQATVSVEDLWLTVNLTLSGNGDGSDWELNCNNYVGTRASGQQWGLPSASIKNTAPIDGGEPRVTEFPLENIDNMRMDILEAVRQASSFKINKNSISPYGLGLGDTGEEFGPYFYKLGSQEGLGLKTYQSDLFNNWISDEWIDGDDGINNITAVSTANGNEFTIDALNLANKIYNMLNRIAISGGSYDDWLDAVYTHERAKGHENPLYHGSLIRELSFEEVVSNADTKVENGNVQPLGTLAGRGKMTGKQKGGKIKIKVNEPSYIMGIVSITPRIDYSQGNKWDTSLKNMNDFHKPAMDEIGFQDLLTDQMAWFDTKISSAGTGSVVDYSSAGKQPAWINYMTNVNQCRGDFAIKDNSMFMTLNRRYEEGASGITDLTTYIDPSKFNNIFAQTSLDSQNFWVQIRNDIFARRKMSAKVMPNL